MTDNVKVDLYTAIKSALLEIEDFQHVLKYNGQDQNPEEETLRNYPQAWIHLSAIEWSPNMLKANQRNTTQEQKGDINVTIYIAQESLLDNDDTFLNDMLLVQKVYRKLAMLQGENFTPLQRVGEIDDVNNNNVRHWEITFSTKVTECGVDDNKTGVSHVTLQINIETEP
jgi:hypothetical protein